MKAAKRLVLAAWTRGETSIFAYIPGRRADVDWCSRRLSDIHRDLGRHGLDQLLLAKSNNLRVLGSLGYTFESELRQEPIHRNNAHRCAAFKECHRLIWHFSAVAIVWNSSHPPVIILSSQYAAGARANVSDGRITTDSGLTTTRRIARNAVTARRSGGTSIETICPTIARAGAERKLGRKSLWIACRGCWKS
jgi:hypothetical protein